MRFPLITFPFVINIGHEYGLRSCRNIYSPQTIRSCNKTDITSITFVLYLWDSVLRLPSKFGLWAGYFFLMESENRNLTALNWKGSIKITGHSSSPHFHTLQSQAPLPKCCLKLVSVQATNDREDYAETNYKQLEKVFQIQHSNNGKDLKALKGLCSIIAVRMFLNIKICSELF